jgi:hypothetical protein
LNHEIKIGLGVQLIFEHVRVVLWRLTGPEP